jgi:hypothetical protein
MDRGATARTSRANARTHRAPVPVTPARLVGARLRAWRGERPLKHSADELGVCIAQVSRWERGLRLPPAAWLERIAGCLGITLPCLFRPVVECSGESHGPPCGGRGER